MHALFAAHPEIYAVVKEVLKAVFWLVLVSLIFPPLEYAFSVRRERILYKGLVTDILWFWVHRMTGFLWLTPPVLFVGWILHSILPTGLTGPIGALPLLVRLPLAFVVYELGLYWGHRWSHEIPFIWRFHAVHHSAEHMGYMANARFHPVDVLLTRLAGLIPLFALGLDTLSGPHAALISIVIVNVGSIWSFFIHANVNWRLGPLEALVASPFFHHWHHTKTDHIDRNYATVLPVMDRIFGTLYMPDAWPAEYGTSTPLPGTMIGQLTAPFIPGALTPVSAPGEASRAA